MTFNPGEKTKGSLDPKALSAMLKEMDQDVATRFVASAFSMDNRKIKEAYILACDEMYLREQEKAKQILAQQIKSPDEAIVANLKVKNSTKALLDTIQMLLKPQATEKVENDLDLTVEPDKDDPNKNGDEK